jgi:DNA-binding response OmpR family regulator
MCGARALLLAQGDGDSKPLRSPAPEPDFGEVPGTAPCILLVEDDYIVAAEAEDALIEAGFRVVGPANSAAQAVSLAATERPALVVMDIRLLGQRDGVDAAREILETTGIRCIFATAHTTPEVRARAQPVSPLDWLPKPYSRQNLVEKVKAALVRLKS